MFDVELCAILPQALPGALGKGKEPSVGGT